MATKIKHIIYRLLMWAILLVSVTSCHSYEEWDNDATGNFDALWSIMDQHYCFFTEKNIDWDAIGEKYRAKIIPGTTQQELFEICADMICEVEDGHVNLASPFDVSYYRKWWTDYPQDFSLRTLQEYYLNFDYRTTCGVIYKILPENIAYIYYPSFSYTVGAGNLDYILHYFSACSGLIIDVRDNGGGEMENIKTFVSRFIHTTTCGGYIRHKTGPGHDDFSEPYPMNYEPADDVRLVWDKPIAVLTNRSCFSSTNDFVSVMKTLPNVKIVGAKTGGGGGFPFTYDLPNGWTIRLSASIITDSAGKSIEDGIEPSDECKVSSPDEELAAGKDAILEFAIKLLSSY